MPLLTDEEILLRAENILRKRINKNPVLDHVEDMAKMFMMRMSTSERELFDVLLVDKHMRMIEVKTLFTGTIDGLDVYFREVLKFALSHNACGLVVAHNHPSGNPYPSLDDVSMTRKLKEMLKIVDITVLDHIVVANDSYTSIAQKYEI